MSYTIITDSCADLNQNMVDELNIDVIPMSFELNGIQYKDYPDQHEMNIKDFYKAMMDKQVSKTAQVTIEEYLEHFKTAYQKTKDILVIVFSSALSGTYNSSLVARNIFLEDHSDANINILDSKCACGGQGLLVYLMAKNRNEKNMTIEENIKWFNDNYLHVCHHFTVEDLGALKRGGRLSATSAFLGTLVGIKPVLHVDNEGRLVPTDKVRGRKAALNKIAEYVHNKIIKPEENIIFINDGDDHSASSYIENKIRELVPSIKEIRHFDVGPVIGGHTGAGIIAVFFMGTER